MKKKNSNSIGNKKEDTNDYDCCGGAKQVYDKRFSKWYSCPKCDSMAELAF